MLQRPVTSDLSLNALLFPEAYVNDEQSQDLGSLVREHLRDRGNSRHQKVPLRFDVTASLEQLIAIAEGALLPITRLSAVGALLELRKMKQADAIETLSDMAVWYPRNTLAAYRLQAQPWDSAIPLPTSETDQEFVARELFPRAYQRPKLCGIDSARMWKSAFNQRIEQLYRREAAIEFSIMASDPLDHGIVACIKRGIGVGSHLLHFLMRHDLVGDELELMRQIAGVDFAKNFEAIERSLSNLERSCLSHPALTDPSLYRFLHLYALFGTHEGVANRSPQFDTMASRLGISPELLRCSAPLSHCVKASLTTLDDNRLASEIVKTSGSWIRLEPQRSIDVTDLALAIVTYIDARRIAAGRDGNALLAATAKVIGTEWILCELERTASYVSISDLEDLQLQAVSQSPAFYKRYLQLLTAGVALGKIKSRREALDRCAAHFDLKSDNYNSVLLERCGTPLSRFERLTEVGQLRTKRAHIQLYEGESLAQFNDHVSDEEITKELASGNYPALIKALSNVGASEKLVIDKVHSGKTRSLVEFEAFCDDLRWKARNYDHFTIDLNHVDSLANSLTLCARVERYHGIYRFLNCVGGWQGTLPHTGGGKVHIEIERGADTKKLGRIVSPCEDRKELFRRFMRHGVLHVAGESPYVYPSGQRPRTHVMITGPCDGRPDAFVSVIGAQVAPLRDNTLNALSIITGIVHPTPWSMQSYVGAQVALIYHREGFSERVSTILYSLTGLFEEAGLNPLDEEDLKTYLSRLISKNAATLKLSHIRDLGPEKQDDLRRKECGDIPLEKMPRRLGSFALTPSSLEVSEGWTRIAREITWWPTLAGKLFS